MSTPFMHFLARNALGLAAFNAAMNAAYTAYTWRGQELLFLFDHRAVALDLANTPVVIALLCTLMGTAAVRRKLADGRIDTADAPAPGPLHALLQRLPRRIVTRSLVLALLAAVGLALPIWLALDLSGAIALPVGQAVFLKVAITIAMTLCIAPIVNLAAWGDVLPAHAPRLAA